MSGSSSSRLLRLGLAVTASLTAQAGLQVPRERVLVLDMRIETTGPHEAAASRGAPGLVWRRDVRSVRSGLASTDGLRVQIRLAGPIDGPWSIRVLSPDGAEVERLTPASFAGAAAETWTEEVRGNVTRLELWREAPGDTPGVRVDRYAYRVVPSVQQAISGEDQRTSIQDAPLRIRRLAPPVARLRFIVPGEGQANCTGFLVGKALFLTNQHCVSTEEELRSAIVDFQFDDASMTPAHVRVVAIEAVSVPLDYALLRLAADTSAKHGRLYFSPIAAVGEKQPTAIIQHPSGLPKQASVVDCRVEGSQRVGVADGDLADFGHTCDTLGGSSGSPVIDWATGRVVGLHHFGFAPGSLDPVNQAVHVQRILDDLKAKSPPVFAEVSQPPVP